MGAERRSGDGDRKRKLGMAADGLPSEHRKRMGHKSCIEGKKLLVFSKSFIRQPYRAVGLTSSPTKKF